VHSLDAVQVLFEIEDKFNINVPERDDQYAAGTVRDLVEGVEQLLAAKAPGLNGAAAGAMQRVVITGVGMRQSAGARRRQHLERHAREGRSGIAALSGLDGNDLRTPVAAQLKGYQPGDHFDDKRLVLLDPVSQYALIATREAVAQAGLRFEGELAERKRRRHRHRIGGASTQDQMARRLYSEGNPRVHPWPSCA
jgi:hypothetical protein